MTYTVDIRIQLGADNERPRPRAFVGAETFERDHDWNLIVNALCVDPAGRDTAEQMVCPYNEETP